MDLRLNTSVAALAALGLTLTMCARQEAPDGANRGESAPLDSSALPDLDFGEDEDEESIGVAPDFETEAPSPARCGGVAHVRCAKGFVCRLDAQESSDPGGTCVRDPRGEFRVLRGLGDRCGGLAGFECEAGLVCKIDDVEHTDPMGTCVTRSGRTGDGD